MSGAWYQKEPGGDWYGRNGDGTEYRLLDVAPTLERDALKNMTHVAARLAQSKPLTHRLLPQRMLAAVEDRVRLMSNRDGNGDYPQVDGLKYRPLRPNNHVYAFGADVRTLSYVFRQKRAKILQHIKKGVCCRKNKPSISASRNNVAWIDVNLKAIGVSVVNYVVNAVADVPSGSLEGVKQFVGKTSAFSVTTDDTYHRLLPLKYRNHSYESRLLVWCERSRFLPVLKFGDLFLGFRKLAFQAANFGRILSLGFLFFFLFLCGVSAGGDFNKFGISSGINLVSELGSRRSEETRYAGPSPKSDPPATTTNGIPSRQPHVSLQGTLMFGGIFALFLLNLSYYLHKRARGKK